MSQPPTTRARTGEPEGPGAEGPAVDPKELKAVQTVVDKLLVSLKTYSLFPPNNVNVKQTLDHFERALTDYFAAHGDTLSLETTPTQLRYQDAIVYENPDKAKSVAFRMNKDGVKEVEIEEGIERQEIMNFFDVFKEVEHVDELEDDFVTILWEKDCPHIRTVVVEEQLDPALVPSIPSGDQMAKKSYGGGMALVAPKEADSGGIGAEVPKQFLSRFTPDILTLTEEEKKALQDRVDKEGQASPLLDLMDILFEIFQLDNDWETFQNMMRLIRKTTESVVVKKKFALGRVLVEKALAARERRDILQAKHLGEIDKFLDDLGAGEAMTTVKGMLLDVQQNVPEDCWEYLKRLRRNAAPHLFEVLRADQHPKEMIEILVSYGPAEFNTYVPGLDDPKAVVVSHVMDLLARLDAKRALPLLIPRLKHPDPTIRTKCIQALAKSDLPDVAKEFLPLLQDAIKDIRLSVLAYFVRNPYSPALGVLQAAYDRRAKLKMDVFEQEQTLTAMGRADPDRAFPYFEAVLRKRPWLWFQRPILEESQKRVVFALARLPGSRPLDVLRAYAEGGAGLVPKICQSALQARGGGGERPAPAPPAAPAPPGPEGGHGKA